MRTIGTIAVITLCGAAACSAPGSARVDVPNISICEFNAHPRNYLGKTIVVSAIHHTIEGYEDYLTDACSDQNFLGIDEWSQNASVREYERARKKECAGGGGLCSLTANVVVELTIEMGAGGHLVSGPTPVGKLNRVLSYQFVRE
jgi:hypothetical protein